MNNRKRLSAMLLAIAMVFALMPTMAFANGDDDISGESRGEPVSFTVSRATGFHAEAVYDQDGDDTSEYYLSWVEPQIEPEDDITVTYENGESLVYHLQISEDYSWGFVSENGEDPDLVELTSSWDNVQSFDEQFTADTYQDFTFAADFFVPDSDDVKTLYYTTSAYLDPFVDDDDDDDDDDELIDFGELPEDSQISTIGLNETKQVSVTLDNPIATFAFVAPETGRYIFEAYGNEDTVGQVRTEDEVIEQEDDSFDSNDNFRIIFEAKEGVTYYLQAKGYDNDAISFQVKVYDASWLAEAEYDEFDYEGEPVTLRVEFGEDDIIPDSITYRWFDPSGVEIQNNNEDALTVSVPGIYRCEVSDGSVTQTVEFNVRLAPIIQNNLYFYHYEGGVYVSQLPDGDENSMVKGSVVIPATITFKDNVARPVVGIDDGGFAGATLMTSVSIPASVTEICEDAFVNTGLNSITIPATVKKIYDKSVGFTSRYDEEKDDNVYTPVPGFVIFGKTGSEAQRYASENGITFRDLEAEEAARRAAAQPKEIQDLPVVKIAKPKAGKKKATVKWKKVTKKNLKKIQGIEIQVASDPGFSQIVKSATAGKKKTSKVVKGLKPKTTYWVRIRAFKNAADGKHVSAWKVKKVKIKK